SSIVTRGHAAKAQRARMTMGTTAAAVARAVPGVTAAAAARGAVEAADAGASLSLRTRSGSRRGRRERRGNAVSTGFAKQWDPVGTAFFCGLSVLRVRSSALFARSSFEPVLLGSHHEIAEC